MASLRRTIKHDMKDILARFFGPFLVRNIKNADTFDKKIDLIFKDRLKLIRPLQRVPEIKNLLLKLDEQKPKYLLEIGTAKGGSLCLFCQAANDRAEIISIDKPDKNFGLGYSRIKNKLYRSFAKGNQKVHLLRGNSHSKETFKGVKEILGKEKLDFLFIDGDHSYEGVKKDFKIYRGLVKKGGFIAFHDIRPNPDPLCRVDVFWREIKDNYKYFEFIEDRNQRGAGIGVLMK